MSKHQHPIIAPAQIVLMLSIIFGFVFGTAGYPRQAFLCFLLLIVSGYILLMAEGGEDY